MSVRVFDPATKLWSIWWIDGRHPHLEPPVHGRLEGVGTFEGDDVFEGRPIRVRFLWSGISARSARWEQAFSADGGATWEVNWVMRFTPAGEAVLSALKQQVAAHSIAALRTGTARRSLRHSQASCSATRSSSGTTSRHRRPRCR